MDLGGGQPATAIAIFGADGLIAWARQPADILAWLERSGTDEQMLYGQGESLARPETAELMALMRSLRSEGEIDLFQKRSAGRAGFDYLAVRKKAPAKPAAVTAKAVAPVLNEIQAGLMLRLRAAARLSERCPTDGQLAKALGTTIGQVKYGFRCLTRLRLIATDVFPVPGNPKFRAVTIMATGEQTAGWGPPR